MKNYFCFYDAGLSGTWLAWFINQHGNFPQYYCDEHEVDGVVTDLCCDGATWCFREDIEDGCEDTPYTYDGYVRRISNRHSQNNQAIKNCIKLLPDHDLSQLDVDSELFDEVMKPIDHIIMPVLDIDSEMVDSYTKRQSFMWGLDSKMYNGSIREIYDNMNNGVYEQKFNKPIHYVHIDQLLNGNDDEYGKLLNVIGEDPLENWKELVVDYRVNFIEKDYD